MDINLKTVDTWTREYLFSRRRSLAQLEGGSNPTRRMTHRMAELRKNIAGTERHRANFGLDPV